MSHRMAGALRAEHKAFYKQLARAAQSGGRTGTAAKKVAALLRRLFAREDQYILVPLGLLTALAKGKAESKMADVIQITDQLEVQLPRLLKEHEGIIAELGRLEDAADDEDKLEYATFVQRLKMHLRTEKEVSYPTAQLIGRYLKMALSGR